MPNVKGTKKATPAVAGTAKRSYTKRAKEKAGVPKSKPPAMRPGKKLIFEGVLIFAPDPTGPMPPSGGRSNPYREVILKMLADLKILEPFNVPVSLRNAFSTIHKDGKFGYGFRWQLVKPAEKVWKVWRTK